MTGRLLAALSFVGRYARNGYGLRDEARCQPNPYRTSLVRNTNDTDPCHSRAHVVEKARPESAHRLVQIDVELAVVFRLERLAQVLDRSRIVARVDEVFRIAGLSIASNDPSKRTIESAFDRIRSTQGRHLRQSDGRTPPASVLVMPELAQRHSTRA